ncbi:hypothetical protein M3P36_00855 [Altererythrobacter sp. KTW20L]|uniref:glycosyltransferase n=1 Tax=Altererythrobacter sp. KTW20L TaxID=2942210 RepID=UPI0020BDA857|nr:hypothetical protein [Altererythrobacter sp. KTW20L]MCL6249599.1 hypothetical protein [Altererythrobacter sp. KTW20L]
MIRILLAWEAGAGRGHVVTLARIARALEGLAVCDASLGWMDHAAEIAPHVDLAYHGARLPYDFDGHRARQAPPNATWADYLLDCHFADPEKLRTNVAWWLETMQVRQIDLVVADYAPRALMAARILGLPALAIGTGYGIPPATLESFPVFLPEYPQREADEAGMVAAINQSLAPLGYQPIRFLPEIYARSGDLLRTLPMLDPYRDWRDPADYLPPVADYAGTAPGTGQEMFCYFSSYELENPALVEALETSGLPTFGYLPGASDAVRARLVQAGLAISDRPLPVAEINARARVMFTSGQHGILSLGMAAGLRQVFLPQHLEHLYMSRKAEERGVGRTIWPRNLPAAEILATLRTAWDDAAMERKARDLAGELAGTFVTDDAALLRQRLAPYL